MPSRAYCLITPCRNEAEHILELVHSVNAQSILPSRWVVVDDGSSDGTAEILHRVESEIPYLRVIAVKDRGRRSVGPGVIDAFYSGLNTVDIDEFDYICKLDADLELPPRYFELLIAQMEGEPRLGTVSGKVFVREEDGREEHEVRGDENSVGPAKFYRVSAFKAIGGFARQVGWDAADGHECRARGWIARSIMSEDLKIIHRRRMGSSDRGLLRGRFRGGLGLWFIGNSWLYLFARCLARLGEKPMVLGSMLTVLGYMDACWRREPRYGDRAYRDQLRRFERRILTYGKRRATEMTNQEILNRVGNSKSFQPDIVRAHTNE